MWQYVARERLELPAIYFASRARGLPPRRDALRGLHVRRALRRRGAVHGDGSLQDGRRHVCTGGVVSEAQTLEAVVAEIATTRVSERETRADDRFSEAAMEDRKRVGYF